MTSRIKWIPDNKKSPAPRDGSPTVIMYNYYGQVKVSVACYDNRHYRGRETFGEFIRWVEYKPGEDPTVGDQKRLTTNGNVIAWSDYDTFIKMAKELEKELIPWE